MYIASTIGLVTACLSICELRIVFMTQTSNAARDKLAARQTSDGVWIATIVSMSFWFICAVSLVEQRTATAGRRNFLFSTFDTVCRESDSRSRQGRVSDQHFSHQSRTGQNSDCQVRILVNSVMDWHRVGRAVQWMRANTQLRALNREPRGRRHRTRQETKNRSSHICTCICHHL